MMLLRSEQILPHTDSANTEIRREVQKSGRGDNLVGAENRLSVASPEALRVKADATLLDQEHLQENVDRLQRILKHVDPRIEISLEKDINRVIFRVVDKESGDLIRQIPSEKIVELDRFLSEQAGLLIEEAI